MRYHLLAIVMTATLASPAEAAPAGCKPFLTGEWVGKGNVTGFGPPIQVDNAYTYRKDGSFLTINRYLGQNKRWTEQRLSGKWDARPGRSRGDCVLEMKSVNAMGTASSTSDIRMIDPNTFRSLGFDMKRVRK